MMNFITIILISASFFLVSCTRQGVTSAKIELTTAFFQSVLGNKGGGGVYLYGFGPGGQRFGKVMNGTSFSESLPNGTWSFFAVAWEATAVGHNLSGVTRCASLKQMTLNGSEVNLSMTLTKSNCESADFTNNVPMNNSLTVTTSYVIGTDPNLTGDIIYTTSGGYSGGTTGDIIYTTTGGYSGGTTGDIIYTTTGGYSGGSTGGGQNFVSTQRFPIFKLEVCNTFPQELSATVAGCNYDTSMLTAPKNKGYFSSVKVMLGSFTKSSSSASAIFDGDEEGVESVCLEIDPSASGSLLIGPADFLNIPFGHTSAPFPFRIRGYYGSANCDVIDSKKGSKTINLLGGRLENSIEGKGNVTANVTNGGGVTTSVGKIYLRTSDEDVCNHTYEYIPGINLKNAGGTGDPGRPYLICTKEEFNSIQNNATSSFKILQNIDFSFSNFVPIGSNVDDYPGGSQTFSGSFDGGGYELKNIFLRKESTGSPGYSMLGLIRNIYNGKVFNLKISDSSIECRPQSSTSTCERVGLIAGQATNAFIHKVYVKGHLVGSSNVGGIVGNLDGNSIIEKAFSQVSIDGDCPNDGICMNVGGLVGQANASNGVSLKINQSASKTSITADNTSNVGGLVGSGSAEGTIEITNSLSQGYVRGKDSVGGLVGMNLVGSASILHDSYSFASVIVSDPGNPDARAGGLVGFALGGNIDRSFHSVGRVVGHPDDPAHSLWGRGSTGSCSNSFGRSNEAADDPTYSSCGAKLTSDLLNVSLHGALGVDSDANINPDPNKKFIKNQSDVGDDYPQLKWERTLLADTGFVIPFLERPCLGKFGPNMLGLGTHQDPFQICSISHLNQISPDKYYKLMRDLDFFQESSTPLNLTGHLNGNNKTIRNATFVDKGGFWDSITPTGLVENLNFENLSLTHAQQIAVGKSVGILAASNSGIVRNVRVWDSKLQLTEWSPAPSQDQFLKVGGLVGKNEGTGVIENVETRPVINFAPGLFLSGRTVEWSVGGIAGENEGAILAASSEIRIISDNYDFNLPNHNHSLFVGGIVGQNKGSINESSGTLNLDIDNPSFEVVTIGKYYFGGIAGYSEGMISNSMGVNHKILLYLTSSPTSAVGGIIGQLGLGDTLTNSYATFDTQNGNAGINRIGGLIGDLSWDDESSMPTGNQYSNLPNLSSNFCSLKDFDPPIKEIDGYNGLCFDSANGSSPQVVTIAGVNTIIPYPGKTFNGWDIIQDQFNRLSTAIWLMRPNELPKLRKLQPWFNDI